MELNHDKLNKILSGFGDLGDDIGELIDTVTETAPAIFQLAVALAPQADQLKELLTKIDQGRQDFTAEEMALLNAAVVVTDHLATVAGGSKELLSELAELLQTDSSKTG